MIIWIPTFIFVGLRKQNWTHPPCKVDINTHDCVTILESCLELVTKLPITIIYDTDFSFMKSSGRSFKRLSLTQTSKCSIVSWTKGENNKITKTNHVKIGLCCADAQQLHHREIHQPVSYCNPATDVSNTFILQQCSTFTSSSSWDLNKLIEILNNHTLKQMHEEDQNPLPVINTTI